MNPPPSDETAVGQVLHGYEVLRREALPHLSGTFYALAHRRTGARHLHVACGDDNNAFTVAFPTIPQDSTGVAHILEHTVLCGSRRFPVRDPFFAMLARSLQTFMNALTSSAWTAYPFSTRNAKDYYNLLDVYLDACFFPLLGETSFLQEAHRFEFARPDDPASALQYKGVVFNEMKGAMASAPVRMYHAIGEAVFPDLTYAHNSGGDPRHIPELTHEALRRFHARHYHPSNAYFYTYGNLPLAETLRRIDQTALADFDRLAIDTRLADQPRFPAPRRFEAAYPLAPSEDDGRKCQVLVTWLTCRVADTFETLALHALEDILLGNAASPLRQALIESNIGTALADGTGFDDEPREAVFAAGLKDVAAEDAERIEGLILDVLREQVARGLDRDLVAGAVHRLEIANREVSNAGFPYGLKVFMHCSSAYLYDGDPYRALLLDHDLDQLNETLRQGRFFESLIQRYLLDNPHRVRLLLRPDPQMTERDEAEEATRLAAIRAGLGEAEVARILADAATLQRLQEAEEDLSSLPELTLADVNPSLEDVPHRIETRGEMRVGLFPQPTNGLTYVDIQLDAGGLPDRLVDLLPVFAYVAPKMGAGPSDYRQMAARISRYTGGVGADIALRTAPDGLDAFTRRFTLSGKALLRHHEPFLAILGDLLTDLRFDPPHLRHLIGQYRAALESRVVMVGHMFALRLADAQLSPQGRLRERLFGLNQLTLARRLASLEGDELDRLVADLTTIRDHLFRRGAINLCVTSVEDQLPALRDALLALAGGLAERPPAAAPDGELAPAPRQPVARTTAVPVAYDAKAFRTVPFVHPDAAALAVLANFLRATFIHREVREKGGAYGGHVIGHADDGLFAFTSYRDPHIVRTLRVFDEAVAYVTGAAPGEREVTEAVLKASTDSDPLLSPDTKGRVRFFGDLAGYGLAEKEAFRRRLLAVRAPDLQRVAATYLGDGAAIAVLGGEEKITAANAELGGVFEVAPV